MNKELKFTIDLDIYEKFPLSLNFSNDSEKDAIKTCMRWYIANLWKGITRVKNKTVSKKAT
ncbi:hypothetical protein [Clostridium paraputrificum]|uniref:hypothetical protein n=1 Tax=Clostridium paraputrificum TaxID=29363 RepID=UPI001FA802EE|nr:hypothetical protein [Clostridium paraputrificum]